GVLRCGGGAGGRVGVVERALFPSCAPEPLPRRGGGGARRCYAAGESALVVTQISTQVRAVPREVDLIPPQVALDRIDVALLLATPCIPLLGGAEIAVLDGPELAFQIIVALRALFSELGVIVVNVGPVASDIADVGTDVARRGCRCAGEQEGRGSRGDQCGVSHGGNSTSFADDDASIAQSA